ncbi:hypothetical protein HS960_13365 [Sphingobacterium paramultivorum]|uniref:Uncharacterized protein n=1 Tax=Sphingobacterium paramultivorum TaxID=2886510 RepID=A0A7G5E3K3_9SPHI|nr:MULTISPECIES: hypothetical protein [Sphingobacterium]MCS4167842.1 hypothetical protein [Sphingobacterium sp. BIGb0116]QMV68578.1 hypothetical protein HS960_13365 [Sphingobacterium paramultivorum]WET69535.1 MAG: hypothetical protein P0Y57_00325 [Sphingobacterium sp.]WSO17521.1 hypothetical protein VUL84_13355 [Sphingobacterium paramultivorum]
MKRIYENFLKIAIVAFLCVTAFTGCKKEEVAPSEVSQAELATVSVSELVDYLANSINVKKSDVTYDAKTQQFKLWGVDQVSREKLIEMFNNSKKLR